MKRSIDASRARRLVRRLHRDVGFLTVGVCLVYGISGILMNRVERTGDPAYRVLADTVALPAGLSPQALTERWRSDAELPALNIALADGDTLCTLMLRGGMGTYNARTGTARYEVAVRRPVVRWLTQLHYNKVRGWSIVADFAAVALLFLAVSGLFIVRGKGGLAGRGKWLVIAGVAVPVVYALAM